MKKITAVLLSALMLCSVPACSSGGAKESSAENVSSASQSSDGSITDTDLIADQSSDESEPVNIQRSFEETLVKYNFKGTAYAEKDGKVIASYADGKTDTGTEYTVDMPIPTGSVSKQFCSAAIFLLQEKGKLSIDDTLDKYYPEYKEAKNIRLKNILAMRSGIPEMDMTIASADKTDEENIALIEKDVFSKPLDFKPDTAFGYSNFSYLLLAEIVEKVSGEKYMDFLRSNFFDPLGMKNTGSFEEMAAGADWANGVKYDIRDLVFVNTKGCGDLLSTGADISLWLYGLSSGKVISKESYEAMTTDHNPGEGYGYGIRPDFFGGVGHTGQIGSYYSVDYLRESEGLTLFYSCSSMKSPAEITPLTSELTSLLRE